MIHSNTSRNILEWMGRSGATNKSPARILDTFDLVVDPADRSLCQHLMQDGFWESWTTAWFTKVIEPGMFCVDVGANYGYVTGLMAELTGPEGLVWAFEPNGSAFSALQQSVRINKWSNVQVFRNGLGDKNETLTLNVADEYAGGASFVLPEPYGIEVKTQMNHQKVWVVTFDELEIPRFPDLIKIDVEGMEKEVLLGMESILEENPLITIELLPPALQELKPGFMEYVFERWDVYNIDYNGDEVPLSLSEALTQNWWMVVLR